MAISNMDNAHKCIPWFFPPANSSVGLCSPFESRSFIKEIDLIEDDECQVVESRIKSLCNSLDLCMLLKHCLPNCEETRYTAVSSAAPFRQCDFRNFKTNPLCDLEMAADSNTSSAMNKPPMWGNRALEEYRRVKW